STKIMSEQLTPLNEKIIITLNDMLTDLDSSNTPEASEITQKILSIKTIWLSIVSEFRLIVANRFGFFGSSEEGLSSRQYNLDILFPQLESELNSFESLISNGEYDFTREIFYPQLKTSISNWTVLHNKTIKMILKKGWRKDIEVLHRIENLLDSFNQTFVLLNDELTRQSVNDIRTLNNINRSLSFFIIMLSLLALLIAIIGYLLFERNILNPITKTTRALLLQSKGKSQELDIHSDASETRDLIEAFNQMSEQIKQREKRLDFMAHHDTLTNLPNRLLFNERLEHATKLTERGGSQLALMVLDLDRFKLINDTLGHLFGDKLLQQTATRLKQAMRSEDTIARLGGDEFAIIIENISSTAEAEIFTNKIIQLFNRPFHIDEQEIHV
ncbi:MAG: GGDEF domain-containing protein, partial [Gammaproteobacteria bacterium]|nr:GGDEF domain-containing protein [Gammaproteobacteria bacterium]